MRLFGYLSWAPGCMNLKTGYFKSECFLGHMGNCLAAAGIQTEISFRPSRGVLEGPGAFGLRRRGLLYSSGGRRYLSFVARNGGCRFRLDILAKTWCDMDSASWAFEDHLGYLLFCEAPLE